MTREDKPVAKPTTKDNQVGIEEKLEPHKAMPPTMSTKEAAAAGRADRDVSAGVVTDDKDNVESNDDRTINHTYHGPGDVEDPRTDEEMARAYSARIVGEDPNRK